MSPGSSSTFTCCLCLERDSAESAVLPGGHEKRVNESTASSATTRGRRADFYTRYVTGHQARIREVQFRTAVPGMYCKSIPHSTCLLIAARHRKLPLSPLRVLRTTLRPCLCAVLAGVGRVLVCSRVIPSVSARSKLVFPHRSAPDPEQPRASPDGGGRHSVTPRVLVTAVTCGARRFRGPCDASRRARCRAAAGVVRAE